MADYVTVKVEGLDQLQDKLHELADKTQTQVVRNAVRAGAQVVEKEMVQRAPKDTGLLAAHFDIRTKKQSGTPDAVAAFVGPNAKEVIHPQNTGKTKGMKRTATRIASFLEFGTIRTAKKPFLTQAFETSKSKALDAIIEKLRAGLAKWLS